MTIPLPPERPRGKQTSTTNMKLNITKFHEHHCENYHHHHHRSRRWWWWQQSGIHYSTEFSPTSFLTATVAVITIVWLIHWLLIIPEATYSNVTITRKLTKAVRATPWVVPAAPETQWKQLYVALSPFVKQRNLPCSLQHGECDSVISVLVKGSHVLDSVFFMTQEGRISFCQFYQLIPCWSANSVNFSASHITWNIPSPSCRYTEYQYWRTVPNQSAFGQTWCWARPAINQSGNLCNSMFGIYRPTSALWCNYKIG